MAHNLTHAGNFPVQRGDAGFLCLVRQNGQNITTMSPPSMTAFVGRFSPVGVQNRVHWGRLARMP